jgi:hypothetical protein
VFLLLPELLSEDFSLIFPQRDSTEDHIKRLAKKLETSTMFSGVQLDLPATLSLIESNHVRIEKILREPYLSRYNSIKKDFEPDLKYADSLKFNRRSILGKKETQQKAKMTDAEINTETVNEAEKAIKKLFLEGFIDWFDFPTNIAHFEFIVFVSAIFRNELKQSLTELKPINFVTLGCDLTKKARNKIAEINKNENRSFDVYSITEYALQELLQNTDLLSYFNQKLTQKGKDSLKEKLSLAEIKLKEKKKQDEETQSKIKAIRDEIKTLKDQINAKQAEIKSLKNS